MLSDAIGHYKRLSAERKWREAPAPAKNVSRNAMWRDIEVFVANMDLSTDTLKREAIGLLERAGGKGMPARQRLALAERLGLADTVMA